MSMCIIRNMALVQELQSTLLSEGAKDKLILVIYCMSEPFKSLISVVSRALNVLSMSDEVMERLYCTNSGASFSYLLRFVFQFPCNFQQQPFSNLAQRRNLLLGFDEPGRAGCDNFQSDTIELELSHFLGSGYDQSNVLQIKYRNTKSA